MTKVLEPLWDTVLIKRMDKLGSIHLPSNAEGSLAMQRGEIVAIGERVRKLKIGDEVFFASGSRAAFAEVVEFQGETFIICQAESVLAVVREKPSA